MTPVFKSLPYVGDPPSRRERLSEWWLWSPFATVLVVIAGAALGACAGVTIGLALLGVVF